MDTRSYLSVLCELVAEGEGVVTVVKGDSMTPFLSGCGDRVYLEKPAAPLRKGDIVLYRRRNGDFILHRIRFVREDGYYMIGDRQYVTEGPVGSDFIEAVVTKAERRGRWITPKSLVWRFYSVLWIRLVWLRPLAFRVRNIFRKRKTTPENE